MTLFYCTDVPHISVATSLYWVNDLGLYTPQIALSILLNKIRQIGFPRIVNVLSLTDINPNKPGFFKQKAPGRQPGAS